MKNLVYLILLFSLVSCSSSTDNNLTNHTSKLDTIIETTNVKDTIESEVNKVGENGLLADIQGIWVNTAFSDSIFKQKKLQPWLIQFYGDIRLIINSSDSITIEGNMDGAETKAEIIDSITFTIPDRVDKPKFTYLSDKKLIIETTNSNIIYYKKVEPENNLSLIGNENEFKDYFINYLFSDFFKEKESITDLWSGFRTYQPFDFDAIGFKDDSLKTKYYGWEIKNDSLFLYNTSGSADEYSGFWIYQIENLDTVIIKK